MPTHTISENTLHLWFAYSDDVLDLQVAQDYLSLLSEQEHARWKSFRFDRHRRGYLVTRALVRIVLSHYRPVQPKDWRFSCNSYGKPYIDTAYGLSFNLSNSPSMVVLLVSQGVDVGVDTEPFDRQKQISEIASEVFSPMELAEFQLLDEPKKLNRCLSLWILKESYIKARGMGLSLPLDQFSFLFSDTESISLMIDPSLNDDAAHWRFNILEHAGHRIALMARQKTIPVLEVWEARPLLTQPLRVTVTHKKWFPEI